MFANNTLLGGGVRVWIRLEDKERGLEDKETSKALLDGKLGHH